MEQEKDVIVKTVVEGFFKKTIKFEVSVDNVTWYEYSLCSLIRKLMALGVHETEIWLMINGIEERHYRIK